MKKLIISLISGAILIGIGLGVIFMEITQYSTLEYLPYVASQPLNSHIVNNAPIISAQDTNINFSDHCGYYFSEHGSWEVVKDSSLNEVKIEVFYRGERPRIQVYNYGDNHYNVNAYDYNTSPKEIFDVVKYAFEEKVIIHDASNFLIEKIVIHTPNPENISIY